MNWPVEGPSERGSATSSLIRPLAIVARPAGFEPAAPSLEGSCSIQLSYGRVAPS